MEKSAFPALGILTAVFLATACTMSEDERCPKGYQYISEIKVCCLEEDDKGNEIIWDGKKCAPVVPEDTNPPETDSAELPEGLGVSCTQSGDSPECQGKEADFCALNPLSPADAYCTTVDCTPGNCPSGYQCCNCDQATLIPKEHACLKDADAATTVEYKQCTCEG
jgi:hypothetical protein